MSELTKETYNRYHDIHVMLWNGVAKSIMGNQQLLELCPSIEQRKYAIIKGLYTSDNITHEEAVNISDNNNCAACYLSSVRTDGGYTASHCSYCPIVEKDCILYSKISRAYRQLREYVIMGDKRKEAEQKKRVARLCCRMANKKWTSWEEYSID